MSEHSMEVRPVGKWVALHKEKPLSVGGLIVPDQHRVQMLRWSVLGVGEQVQIKIKPGDSIYLRPGTYGLGYHPATDDYWLVEEEFIAGVIEKDFSGLVMRPSKVVTPS